MVFCCALFIHGVVADVAVTLTGFVGSIIAGDLNTYNNKVLVENKGTEVASGVFMNHSLPSAFGQFAAMNPVIEGQGSCLLSLTGVFCGLGDLVSGQRVLITIPYVVPPFSPSGPVLSTACVGVACSSWPNLILRLPPWQDAGIGNGWRGKNS